MRECHRSSRWAVLHVIADLPTGGNVVSHLLRRTINGAIVAVIVVIGVAWAVGVVLYLGGLALMIGGTPQT